jgi:AcrR family transcriptional regulator
MTGPITPRPALSRQSVIAAAIDLADRQGLDTLSMRGLAAELGVVPMALYKHVRDKDDLVGGMIDAVVSAYPAPGGTAGPAGWRPRLRDRVLGARALLLAHPWMRPAIESRRTRTPAVLGHMDAVAGELLAGGLTADLAHHAMHALGHRIWGFNPEAFDEGRDARSATEPVDEAAMAAVAARYPSIVAIAVDAGARTGTGACDDDGEFAFTLDLLLDAVERLHAAGWESAPLPR